VRGNGNAIGNDAAISKRQTTCDYPGGTKPKFKTDFQRDGILRVSKVVNEHLTEDQAGSTYGSLGTFEYTYDSSSNVLTAEQNDAMGAYLEAGRDTVYDTLNRLITTDHADKQGWLGIGTSTSWYQYDDLGNRISHKNRADAGTSRTENAL
jgi:YD repeat-containing protein